MSSTPPGHCRRMNCQTSANGIRADGSPAGSMAAGLPTVDGRRGSRRRLRGGASRRRTPGRRRGLAIQRSRPDRDEWPDREDRRQDCRRCRDPSGGTMITPPRGPDDAQTAGQRRQWRRNRSIRTSSSRSRAATVSAVRRVPRRADLPGAGTPPRSPERAPIATPSARTTHSIGRSTKARANAITAPIVVRSTRSPQGRPGGQYTYDHDARAPALDLRAWDTSRSGWPEPAADLIAAGHDVRCLDLAVDHLDEASGVLGRA